MEGMVIMRLTEYIHWINRKDLGLGKVSTEDPWDNDWAPMDYTHLTIFNKYKRDRYFYQCKLKGKEPVK